MSEPSVEPPYPYAGVPLTPRVFGQLALELLNGSVLKRVEICQRVEQHHRDRGGAPSTQPVEFTAKKALSDLAKIGVAGQVPNAVGFWRIGELQSETDDSDDLDSDSFDGDEYGESPTGFTHEYVYVYDLPSYAELAGLHGKTRWPHKIGFTRNTPEARIASQVGTALPEHPRIVLTHECSNAMLLETAIHAVLELRGQKISSGPGTEWFDTNPEEVAALIRFVIEGQGTDDLRSG